MLGKFPRITDIESQIFKVASLQPPKLEQQSRARDFNCCFPQSPLFLLLSPKIDLGRYQSRGLKLSTYPSFL